MQANTLTDMLNDEAIRVAQAVERAAAKVGLPFEHVCCDCVDHAGWLQLVLIEVPSLQGRSVLFLRSTCAEYWHTFREGAAQA